MTKDRISLTDFVKAKKREGCPVCALPGDIREEMSTARKKTIKRGEVLEWLTALGYDIQAADLDGHYSGKHDQ